MEKQIEYNCSNCKFWRKIRNEDYIGKDFMWPGPHGECLRIDENSYEASKAVNNNGKILWDDPARPAWIDIGNIIVSDKDIGWTQAKYRKELDYLDLEISDSCLITKPEFYCNLYKKKDVIPNLESK